MEKPAKKPAKPGFRRKPVKRPPLAVRKAMKEKSEKPVKLPIPWDINPKTGQLQNLDYRPLRFMECKEVTYAVLMKIKEDILILDRNIQMLIMAVRDAEACLMQAQMKRVKRVSRRAKKKDCFGK